MDQHDHALAIESLQCPSRARDDLALTPWEVSGLRELSGSLCHGSKPNFRFEHTVGTMRKLNKLLRQAQQSCSRPWILHGHRAPCVVAYSDAACAVRRKGESQAGNLTCLADAESLTSQEGPLSLVSWHSGRCRRIAHSSLSAEVQAAGEAQEEGECVRLVFVDLLFQDVNMWNASDQIALLPGALVLPLEASQVHWTCQTSDQHWK